MNDLPSAPGFVTLLITVVILHAASLLVLLAILFEYVRIHAKRMRMLKVLDARMAHHSVLERLVLTGLYIASTAGIIIGSTLFFFTYLS